MPPYVKRVHPDPLWFDAILTAIERVEKSITDMIDTYHTRTAGNPPTERINHFPELEITF